VYVIDVTLICVRSTSVISSSATPTTKAPTRPNNERKSSPKTSPNMPPGSCSPNTRSVGKARCTSAQPTTRITTVAARLAAPKVDGLRANRRSVNSDSSKGMTQAARPKPMVSRSPRPWPTAPIQLPPVAGA
jgi:hypothetical protein